MGPLDALSMAVDLVGNRHHSDHFHALLRTWAGAKDHGLLLTIGETRRASELMRAKSAALSASDCIRLAAVG